MKVLIVVPSESKGQMLPAPLLDQANELVGSTLADLFGGFNATSGFGGWVNDEGVVVRETIRSYSSSMGANFNPHTVEALFDLARNLKDLLSQESVYLSFLGESVHFI